MDMNQKSLSELRTIAQSLGVADIFSLPKPRLIQEIQIKMGGNTAKSEQKSAEIPERNKYDVRLMTGEPASMLTLESAREVLSEHINRGLSFSVSGNTWEMKFNKKSDSGSMHMLLRTLLDCADKVLK